MRIEVNIQSGEVVELPDAPGGVDIAATVPQKVTMRQARLALLQGGYLTTINAAIAAMPGAAGDAARIEWEFSSTVERNRPLVAAMASALNLTSAQIDDLFKLAATL